MAKPVEENYLITIKGTMEQNGENDTVELMTRGNFVQRGNSYYIVYAETEATGYAGCTTTVRVSQDARRQHCRGRHGCVRCRRHCYR